MKTDEPKKVRCCDCGRLRPFCGERFYCALLQKEFDSNERFNTWIKDIYLKWKCEDFITEAFEIRPVYFGFSCTG